MDVSNSGNSVIYKTEFQTPAAGAGKTQVDPQVEERLNKLSTPEVSRYEVSSNEMDAINKGLAGYGLGVNFALDNETNQSVLKIVDRQTSEVVRQYPSEDALKMIKSIQEYLSQPPSSGGGKQELTGALFNEMI